MTDTDLNTADRIVADAERALQAIDEKIAYRRADRRNVAEEIKQLLEERKPLARIVAASTPRKSKAQANGD